MYSSSSTENVRASKNQYATHPGFSATNVSEKQGGYRLLTGTLHNLSLRIHPRLRSAFRTFLGVHSWRVGQLTSSMRYPFFVYYAIQDRVNGTPVTRIDNIRETALKIKMYGTAVDTNHVQRPLVTFMAFECAVTPTSKIR